MERFALCYRTVFLSVRLVLWPNGWMDQDETWHAGKPQPWPHCVKWRPAPPERGTAAPLFSAHMIIAKRSAISATTEHLLQFLGPW